METVKANRGAHTHTHTHTHTPTYFFVEFNSAYHESYVRKSGRLPESVCELYRSSDRRLLAKFVPTFVDKECDVVSVTDPYGRILGFLDRGLLYYGK
jgi:hypothetical protein